MKQRFFHIWFWVGMAWCWAPLLVHGQQEVPDGRFLELQAQVGEPVHYMLRFRHSPGLEVVFPSKDDEAFGHFEVLEKAYFPTSTDGEMSLDSVVYTVSTFETELRQGLALPIYVADASQENGLRPIFAPADTLTIKPLVEELPDSLQFFEKTEMAHVKQQLNYPLYLLVGGVSFAVMLAALVVFGGRILRWWKLRRLRQEHELFISEFEADIADGNLRQLEAIIAIWKQYVSSLLEKPLMSYTTKEIANALEAEEVTATLRFADRIVYGNEKEPWEVCLQQLHVLKAYAQTAYEMRREQLAA